jgi:arabinose-5-phosphate isomerase
MIPKDSTGTALDVAREVFKIEAAAVRALIRRVDDRFLAAVSLVLGCRKNGRVIVTGIGKSGHIARKIASTLSSTGTPAYFLHAAEAGHGDLGLISRDDVVIAVSNSGESDELRQIVPLIKRQGARIVVIAGNANSSLAREAHVFLDAGVKKEACPHNLAPTASAIAALAMGDALAVALLQARRFSADQFARAHPGGTLGRKLVTLVSDVMRTGAGVPKVQSDATLADALLEITRTGMGMTAIVDRKERLLGVFTDGDLRRSLQRKTDPGGTGIKTVMTRRPRTVRPDALAVTALEAMESRKTIQLPVVDATGRLVGALNIHDLFRAKIV